MEVDGAQVVIRRSGFGIEPQTYVVLAHGTSELTLLRKLLCAREMLNGVLSGRKTLSRGRDLEQQKECNSNRGGFNHSRLHGRVLAGCSSPLDQESYAPTTGTRQTRLHVCAVRKSMIIHDGRAAFCFEFGPGGCCRSAEPD